MVRESINVFWNQEVDSFKTAFHFSNLQNFHVIPHNVWCNLERWNIDYVNIWIFWCKYSAYLSIFFLQKLFHRNSFQLFNWKRVDMNFYSFALLNCLPLLFKFFHHFLPNKQRFVCQFLYSFFGLLLFIFSIRSLYFCAGDLLPLYQSYVFGANCFLVSFAYVCFWSHSYNSKTIRAQDTKSWIGLWSLSQLRGGDH